MCNGNRFTCLFLIGFYMYAVSLHMNLLPAMAVVTALEVLTGSATLSAPLKGPGCPCLRPGPTWYSRGTCWEDALQWLHPVCSGAALKLQPLALFWARLQLLTPLILLHCAGSTPDLPCHHGLVCQSVKWWLNWIFVTRPHSGTVGLCPFSMTMAPAACSFCSLTTAA